jgi:serine/threonine protein phosphatase 1
MSDIHGNYQKYKEMLAKINFSEEDTLYIVGDILDRGEEGLRILLDIARRFNVIPILGNHELLAGKFLTMMLEEVNEETIAALTLEKMQALQDWMLDGGAATLQEFKKLSPLERETAVEFLAEFSLAEEIEVNGKVFLMVHAGLPTAAEYDVDELDFDVAINPTDYTKPAFGVPIEKKYFITGHLPTLVIPGGEKGKIFIRNGHIAIDCGCAFGGSLGCLRLEDLQEFYV